MREFKIWDEVTLVEGVEQDGLTISDMEVAEVIDFHDLDEEVYIIAFQELVNEEGVTPIMYVKAEDIERH